MPLTLPSSAPHPPDIAIVGMSVLLPGAKSLRQYWHNILNKVDSVREAPDDWANPYYEPDSALTTLDSARIYTRKVGLLAELAEFCPLDFGVPPRAVEGDPAHFLALALARDALQDAHYLERPFNHRTTGIVVGRGANPNRGDTTGLQYGLMVDQTLDLLQQLLPGQLPAAVLADLRQGLKANLPAMEIDQAPSLVSNVLTGRIANRLDLMGPNYLVDAACSSSLIAVAHAIDDLVSGRSDMMLAGGVQVSMSAQIYMLFCQLKALSHGNIRPFDADASGTILGEGVGFLALKRLADAQQDGDRIYAVIKGVGISSDGKSRGLLAPRAEGQVLALERAYAQTGIDPSTIGLIEAHGTGIPLGDRTEIETLSQIFGDRQGHLPNCAIGSVKSMIGHCIPASGIASLAKVALSLYHKVLPPMLCDRPHPDLNIEQTPFYINTEVRPWIQSSQTLRRAAINAFGFGGINTHAILEEVDRRPNPVGPVWQTPDPAESFQTAVWTEWPSELLVLAAASPAALVAKLQQVQTFLAARLDVDLSDIAYTLAQERVEAKNEEHRLALVVKTRTDAARKLEKASAKLQSGDQQPWQIKGSIFYSAPQSRRGKTAFLFSTEGSQYAQMLADLCLYFPPVRAWFDFLDETFERTDRPSQIIFAAPTGLNPSQQRWAKAELFAADLATETISTGSLALYELLKAFGVPCDVMLGHSAGEHVAMRAAGMVEIQSRSHLKDLLQKLNQLYAQLEQDQAIPTGVLLSVGSVTLEDLEKLLAAFANQAYLVADNCTHQRLIFVHPDQQAAVIEFVKQVDGICTPIPFDRAYHTPLFAQGAQALRAYYEELALGTGQIPVYSCASTEPYPQEPDRIRDLSAAQWSLPVRFRETIERLYADGVRTFVEVGAGNSLTNFVNNILPNRGCLILPTNVPRRSGLMQIQAVIGQLWAEGTAIDFSPLYSDRPLQQLDWNLSEPPPKRATLPLNMALPRMQLAPEIAANVQQQIIQTVQTAQTAQAQVPPSQPAPPLAPPLAGSPSASKLPASPPLTPPKTRVPGGTTATSPSTTGLPAAIEAAPATLASQQKILEEHLTLMDKFLTNQASVSKQAFQQLGALSAQAAQAAQAASQESIPLPSPQEFAPAAPRSPISAIQPPASVEVQT